MTRILLYTPYPPDRDGIGAYAVQLVARMRADGDDVEVCSPEPSAAHHHLDLHGPRRGPAIVALFRRYDRVLVQWHPDFFYPNPIAPGQMVAANLTLAAAFRIAGNVEVQIHETEYRWGQGPGPAARSTRLLWRVPKRIVVHTPAERDDLHRAYRVPLDRIELTDHGVNFTKRTTLDRAGARARFGLPTDEVLFLSIGFVAPHKGFDRTVAAFVAAGLGAPGSEARLVVAGSVRTDDPDCLAFADDLRRAAAPYPQIETRFGYLSDEAFDRWIVAADVVVLPYRHIWSSSVVERALLYGRQVIATRVGGLADQVGARAGTTLVDDDIALREAILTAARSRRAHPALLAKEPMTNKEQTDASDWPAGRDAVQEEVRRRAASSSAVASSAVASAAEASSARAQSGPAAARAGIIGSRSATGGAAAALRRIPPLLPAAQASARPGATLLKKVVRRLTAWEVDPVIAHVNRVHQAMTEAVEYLDEAQASKDR